MIRAYNPQSRFFFGTRGAKKKLGKKKTPILWALPKPASCPKSLTKTFLHGYSANTPLSTVEHTYYAKKITPFFKVFERMGVWGKEKLFLKSFLSPTKIITINQFKGKDCQELIECLVTTSASLSSSSVLAPRGRSTRIL